MTVSLHYPDFFIVGAQRSGTTALYEYLRQHPAIFMSAPKETHYFSNDRVRVDADLKISSESAYLGLFSHAPSTALCAEASPSYLWHPHAAERIYARQPNAKIIAILRDPIRRAFSQYLMDLGDGLPAIPFYDLIVREFQRGEKVYGTGHLYVELGMYGAQIKRYLDLFGPESVLVLAMNDLTGSAVHVLQRVAAFLEVDPEPFATINVSQVYSKTGVPAWELLRRALPHRFVRQMYRRFVPLTVRRTVRERMFVSQPASDIDARAVEFLRSVYAPDLVALDKLTAISFPEMADSQSLSDDDA